MKRVIAPLSTPEALNDPLEIVGGVDDPQFAFASYNSFIVFICLSEAVDRDGSRSFLFRRL
jgi:hypothetical protein